MSKPKNIIQVVVTQEEKRRIQANAKVLGLKLSAFFKMLYYRFENDNSHEKQG